MQPKVIEARNVNDALAKGLALMDTAGAVARLNCRPNTAGSVVIEHKGPVITMYARPCERVLFSPQRNANPFFHFFEALWILAGRNDAEWLCHFNKRMREFAEGGTFHGAYGHRLREPVDQVRWVVRELSERPDSRRATMSIFDAARDHTNSKDIPCNDTLSFMIREDCLHLTVYCRSNDMVWGAYGANVVQFSTLQELIARSIGVAVGTYTQISNSFHVYEEEPTWQRLATYEHRPEDRYNLPPIESPGWEVVQPYNMLIGIDRSKSPGARLGAFDSALLSFMRFSGQSIEAGSLMRPLHTIPYFDEVAIPLFNAWQCYKVGDLDEASVHVKDCHASDWNVAASGWLSRTRMAKAARREAV